MEESDHTIGRGLPPATQVKTVAWSWREISYEFLGETFSFNAPARSPSGWPVSSRIFFRMNFSVPGYPNCVRRSAILRASARVAGQISILIFPAIIHDYGLAGAKLGRGCPKTSARARIIRSRPEDGKRHSTWDKAPSSPS